MIIKPSYKIVHQLPSKFGVFHMFRLLSGCSLQTIHYHKRSNRFRGILVFLIAGTGTYSCFDMFVHKSLCLQNSNFDSEIQMPIFLKISPDVVSFILCLLKAICVNKVHWVSWNGGNMSKKQYNLDIRFLDSNPFVNTSPVIVWIPHLRVRIGQFWSLLASALFSIRFTLWQSTSFRLLGLRNVFLGPSIKYHFLSFNFRQILIIRCCQSEIIIYFYPRRFWSQIKIMRHNRRAYKRSRQYWTTSKWTGSEVHLGDLQNIPSNVKTSMNVPA